MDPYGSDRTTPEKSSPCDAAGKRESLFTDSPIDISENVDDCLNRDEDSKECETTKKKSRTKGNEEKDTDAEEKPPHMKRSESMLRFDKWNVGDRYKLIRVLGQGSYGEVAEAWDTK